jgi:hypothetical protein
MLCFECGGDALTEKTPEGRPHLGVANKNLGGGTPLVSITSLLQSYNGACRPRASEPLDKLSLAKIEDERWHGKTSSVVGKTRGESRTDILEATHHSLSGSGEWSGSGWASMLKFSLCPKS